MATYKGRDVQILKEINDDHLVEIQTQDGKEIVKMSEVTIFDPKDLPTPVVLKGEKPLTDDERRIEFYHKPTPKQIEHEKNRQANKAEKEKRMVQYKKDNLDQSEIDLSEKEFYAKKNKAEAPKVGTVQPVPAGVQPQPVTGYRTV